ncbi:acetylxylan esterase [Microbacterium telephonicum]|uniref:Cephalosporin-C deacetylase n=1 Tax=Microbacterium telephonicum TaxID=1714841 RepID=A0A498BYG8_9MICO|nr:acetylxylan esterase [Microbacterium telephonicum]RLK47847.1 cephalosporin-C deacetylase [Microbacterium telephonicum]
MPRFDLSPAELAAYLPEVREPADFDAFWQSTLAQSRAAGGGVTVTPVPHPFTTVDVSDVTFPGFAGDPVKAWLITPRGVDGPLPVVVEYIGYGGGRGVIGEKLGWASAGYAHFVMDTRGQGSAWGTGGDTPDPHGSGAAFPGYMTRGIDDPAAYYYRRVFTDAARAVDAVRTLPGIDPARVSVVGASQGGGIAIAAAGLSDGLVASLPEVPFLCHFERAIGLTDRDPYNEVVRYLSVHRGAEDRVFETLSYFDGANFAKRATSATLFSVALMDFTCPPSTVYAAFNHYRTDDKQIEVYPYNDHEGGQTVQFLRQAAFLAARV